MGTYDNLVSTFEGASSVLGLVPGVSDVISAASIGYHSGAAAYDVVTGDRDGAVAHGVQAAYGGAGLALGNSTLDGIDAGLGMFGTMSRIGETGMGHDASQVPVGLSDLLSGGAVAATNAIFGADDTNLIASGDTPQGTREGEIAAGTVAMGALGLAGGSALGIPFGIQSAMLAGPAIGELFGADLAGPTSGAKGPEGWVKALSEAF